jgi:hypothetical protein
MGRPVGFPGGGLRLARACTILCGVGNPNSSTTPDVVGAGAGSLFLQQDGGGALWISSGAGVWVQVSVQA